MSQLPFTKVEGLGNDFVVVDLRARAGSPEAAAVQDPALVRKVCDRRFGVGGDGVLAILPGSSGDARMRVLNADGSEAEMCGNGIRCVAKVLYESEPALRKPVIKIDTGAGLLACEMTASGGRVDSVTVEMGRPRFTRDELPLAPGGAARVTREAITALDRTFRFTAVSMGNPHAVIFVDDPTVDLMALATKYGPALETAPTFPRRTNVEFARVRRAAGGKDAEIDLVVWERGCGITLACGTGACATGVAAAVEERLPRGRELLVHLPGGPLGITVAPDDSGVRMRGPARVVFRSELDLGAFGES
ncbi:MAG TPA: diaminopimelate epimerase [Polyangia bacterium]|nr:diaminopimelate epimerase [Polyangia bacterium]